MSRIESTAQMAYAEAQKRREKTEEAVKQLCHQQVEQANGRGGCENRLEPPGDVKPGAGKIQKHRTRKIDRSVFRGRQDLKRVKRIPQWRRDRRIPEAAVLQHLHLKQIAVFIRQPHKIEGESLLVGRK